MDAQGYAVDGDGPVLGPFSEFADFHLADGFDRQVFHRVFLEKILGFHKLVPGNGEGIGGVQRADTYLRFPKTDGRESVDVFRIGGFQYQSGQAGQFPWAERYGDFLCIPSRPRASSVGARSGVMTLRTVIFPWGRF